MHLTHLNSKVFCPKMLFNFFVSFAERNYIGSGLPEERRIPLLQEVFKSFPNIPINIDIKRNDDTLIKEVSKLVQDYYREELTVWGNISNTVTAKCYQEVWQLIFFL